MSFKIALNDETQKYELTYKKRVIFASNEKDFILLYLVGHLMDQKDVKNISDFEYKCTVDGCIESIVTKTNSYTAQEIEDQLFNPIIYQKVIGENLYFIRNEMEIVGINPTTFDFSCSSTYPVFTQKNNKMGVPALIGRFGSYKNLEKYFDEYCEQYEKSLTNDESLKGLSEEQLQKLFFSSLEKFKLNIDENMNEFEKIATQVLNLWDISTPIELFKARNVVEFIRTEESKYALDLSKFLSDRIYSVELAYQSFFQLDPDDWHQHANLEQTFLSSASIENFIKENRTSTASCLRY